MTILREHWLFFFCFGINNWRSVQRNLCCLPMRCKMLHETQSLWPEAFKWATLDTPELDREQRGGLWPPWGPLPVWRRRLCAAGLNEFWGGNVFRDPGRLDQTFLVISFDVADVARQGLQGLELSFGLTGMACRLRPCSSSAEATRRDEPAIAGEPFRILGPGLDGSFWWFELLVILMGNTSKSWILEAQTTGKKIWDFLPRHQLYSNWRVPGPRKYYIGGDPDEDAEDAPSEGCGPRGLGFLWVLVYSVWHGHKYIKSASRTTFIIDLVNQSSSWKFIYVHLAPHCTVVLLVAEMKRLGIPWWCIRSGATPKGLV